MKRVDNENEQALCRRCGLCCDGTIFSKAGIRDLSDLESADSLQMDCFEEGGKRYYRLPCHLFQRCCTVYSTRQRPHICEAFICRLIKDVRHNKVSMDFAMEKINNVRSRSDNLMKEMSQIDALKKVSISRLNEALSEFKKNTANDIDFRKKYGSIMIQLYALNQMLKKYFLKKKIPKRERYNKTPEMHRWNHPVRRSPPPSGMGR